MPDSSGEKLKSQIEQIVKEIIQKDGEDLKNIAEREKVKL